LLKKTLALDELRAAVKETATGTHANGTVRRGAERLIAQAVAGDSLASDLLLHDGDLVLQELRTGAEPFVGLLVVRGDLIVEGLYQDCLDPESTVIVTGDLRAQRLVSEGLLEVHGSVVVEREALWMDNDGCAEIFVDLSAAFTYTKYHSVKVHGRVVSPLVLGDDRHIDASQAYAFVKETGPSHKSALRAVLPEAALSLEGDPEDGEDEWCIDYVKCDVLQKLVVNGSPVLRAPWLTKGA
jgi:hypothetical protein